MASDDEITELKREIESLHRQILRMESDLASSPGSRPGGAPRFLRRFAARGRRSRPGATVATAAAVLTREGPRAFLSVLVRWLRGERGHWKALAPEIPAGPPREAAADTPLPAGPILVVEAPRRGEAVAPDTPLVGFALDPGGVPDGGPGVHSVRVYAGSRAAGRLVTEAYPRLPREEPSARFRLGESFRHCGFEARLSGLDPGEQLLTLCAVRNNAVTGSLVWPIRVVEPPGVELPEPASEVAANPRPAEARSEVADYWDRNREKAKDPTFWMAIPLCRAAINRRISGSPDEWPMDWFQRVHAPAPFPRGASFGCGAGPFERAARRCGLIGEIDAMDLSEASLADARRLASEEGIGGIRYRIGDFNRPRLEPRRYDIACFHGSLHHVWNLERLFASLASALKPRGAIYLDEYVGPSRDRWTDEKLSLARRVYAGLPDSAKVAPTVAFPIEANDPSEMVRCGEIRKFVEEYFDLVEWKPFGGQLLGILVPLLKPDWVGSDEGQRAIRAMLDLEEEELRKNPGSTHHVLAYGRLKARYG